MNYFRPNNLKDALKWLSQNNADIAAGCTDLLAMTESQYAVNGDNEHLLDVTAIEGLRGITTLDHGIRIGAATRWSDIIHEDLPPAFDGLKAAAREVGSVQIRNAGTIGGNLCNASPAADGVPPLLTLDASVELVSIDGMRELNLYQFLLDVRKTALRADELLSAIIIPLHTINGISGFTKLGARKYLVISIAMVAVRLEISKNIISDIAISVGSCSAVACRLMPLEKALIGTPVNLDLEEAVHPDLIAYSLSPIDDIRADSAYRLRAAREIVIECIDELLQSAKATL